MRGCISPVAIAWIRIPAGTVGDSPAFQPTTCGTLIGGMRYWLGSGSTGSAPYCLDGSPPLPLQAVISASRISPDIARVRTIMRLLPVR